MDIFILVAAGIISRLLPHPPNFTAVGALAIFSGSQLGTKKALFITISTMFISDLFLGFHAVMWATYGCMAAAVLFGRLLHKRQSPGLVAGVTLSGSVIFFIITNFAVWAVPQSMYPHTPAGLIQCYVMAIPFFRNSLFGDFFYTGLFFSAYALIKGYVMRPREKIIF